MRKKTNIIIPRDGISNHSHQETKSRLDDPIWRLASIIITVAAGGLIIYSLVRQQWIIAASAIIFFLMLWFFPFIWKWIVFAFNRKPETTWERISLNLALATLAALVFEDFFEVLFRLFRMVRYIITR